MERDIFKRGHSIEDHDGEKEKYETEVEISVFELVEAFYRIVATIGKTEFMEIDVEKMSLNDRINEIMGRLSERKKLSFDELLGDCANKRMILYTFLAILELMRLRMIKVFQASPLGVIRIVIAEEK